MKTVLLTLSAAALLAAALPACTTLENRRDLYSPQRVDGPYTRMLRDGIPRVDPTPSPTDASHGKNVR